MTDETNTAVGEGDPVEQQLDEITSLTERVVTSFGQTGNERLRQLLQILVERLHAYIREVHLTRHEWSQVVDFLTAVGHTCNADRQEFVLLSDVLGVSMLVELLNDVDVSTETTDVFSPTLPTVLGPFHMTSSPVRSSGSAISELGAGTPLLLQVAVRGADGSELAGAAVDVWQCNSEGFYDVQQPDVQPAGNGRGMFTADDHGRVECMTVVPSFYPIPTDGPVGKLLGATGREPWRPAHIHFRVDADGYVGLTTHVFLPNSLYLDSDAVFAVRPSLVCDVFEEGDPEMAERYGVPTPFARTEVELVLRRARAAERSTRAGTHG